MLKLIPKRDTVRYGAALFASVGSRLLRLLQFAQKMSACLETFANCSQSCNETEKWNT